MRLVRCETDWCERLAIGATADGAQPLAVLAANERCSEIVWSPDGKRVGFVINGQQLRLYEAATHKPAGQVDLVARDSDPPTRVARGITFSENGAAITFDDCPRQKSGCQPRILALDRLRRVNSQLPTPKFQGTPTPTPNSTPNRA